MKLSIDQVSQIAHWWLEIGAAEGSLPKALVAWGGMARALDSVVCTGPLGFMKRKPSSMGTSELIRFCTALLPKLSMASAELATLIADLQAFNSAMNVVMGDSKGAR